MFECRTARGIPRFGGGEWDAHPTYDSLQTYRNGKGGSSCIAERTAPVAEAREGRTASGDSAPADGRSWCSVGHHLRLAEPWGLAVQVQPGAGVELLLMQASETTNGTRTGQTRPTRVPAGRLHTLTVGPAPHSDVVLHTCACAERPGGAVEETQPMTSKTQTYRQQQQQLGRRAERTLGGLDGPQPEKPPAGAGKREQAPLTLQQQQQQSAKRSKKLGQWEQLKAGALARLEWLCLQLYPKRAGAAQGTGGDRGGAQQPLPRRGEDDEGAAGSERQEDTVV
ncbi:unnamed protein product [Lampetra fluviatilis]